VGHMGMEVRAVLDTWKKKTPAAELRVKISVCVQDKKTNAQHTSTEWATGKLTSYRQKSRQGGKNDPSNFELIKKGGG